MFPAFMAANKILTILTASTSKTQNLDCKCKVRVLNFLFTLPYLLKKPKAHGPKEIKERSVGFFDVLRGRQQVFYEAAALTDSLLPTWRRVFHSLLKGSQVEHSSSRRGLDETLSPLIPVVFAELLQSWKALGKTVWFSAKVQLGNSGVFCCSWFLVTEVIVLQSTFHLMVRATGFPNPRTRGVCVGLLRRMEKKALWFSPPCPSHQQCSLTAEYERKNRPSAQQLLPPPTRPSLCPLQKLWLRSRW